MQACHNCKAKMESGSPGVIAARMPGECWHPGCFACSTCRQLLVDNIYFFREGRVYCGRHYADQLYPRCMACDEVGMTSMEVKWCRSKGVDFFFHPVI